MLVPMVGATAAARLDRLAWISAQRRSAAVFLQVELARPPRDAAMRLTLGAEHEGWVIRAEGAATVPDAIAAIAVALGAREILVGSSAQPAGRRGRREVGAAVADRLDALRVARIAEQRRAAARFAQERRRMERDVLRGLITAGSDRAGRIAALFDAERARFPRGDRRRPLPSVTWVA
ncbi:MAG: hypothetical protein ABMB14_28815 [Myxococcota bacterium]